MGRRNDHSPEALKALALAAARDIVKQSGLSGLTVRRIAEEIGYSPGTLYNHFANVDDLILRLNTETLSHLLERLVEISRREEPAAAILRAMARAYIAETKAEPEIWAALYEHRMAKGAPLPAWYAAYLARLFEPVERALAPLFRPQDQEARRRTARILWSAVHGIASLGTSRKLDLIAAIPAEEMADELVTTFLAGLRPA